MVRAQPATDAAHLQRLEHDRAALLAAHDAQHKAWAAAQQHAAAQHAEHLNALTEQARNTQATLTWTESQLQNHKQSIQELHAQIDSLKQSTSWRITAPLRKLLSKISD